MLLIGMKYLLKIRCIVVVTTNYSFEELKMYLKQLTYLKSLKKLRVLVNKKTFSGYDFQTIN